MQITIPRLPSPVPSPQSGLSSRRRSSRAGRFWASLLLAVFACAPSLVAQALPPLITSSTNAPGTVGEAFGYQIIATGSPTNYGAANLPAGLIPPGTSGFIGGLPQVAGVFTSQITAANAEGTATNNLKITINPPPVPVMTSPTTAVGVQNQNFRFQLLSSPNHSNVPTTFSISGLPDATGLRLTTEVTSNTAYPNVAVTNYYISGFVQTNGSFVLPVVVRNQAGATTNSLTLVLSPTNRPVFSPASATVSSTVGTAFSYDVTALNQPFRYRVTNIAVGPNINNLSSNAVTVTNGVLTNGLSFSNVTNGGNVVGRVFGVPAVSNVVRLMVEALNGAGASLNSFELTINNNLSQPNLLMVQPLGEQNYVAGSSFFLNAQVFNNPDNTLVPGSFKFTKTVGSATTDVSGSVGIFGEYFGVEYFPEFPSESVRAVAQNSFGQANQSFEIVMNRSVPQNPLPAIEMLPLQETPTAGLPIRLRARATIASIDTNTRVRRVEFYVNKVFVGFAASPVPGSADEFNFTWTTPATPGTFQISARAVSLNVQAPERWGSVIARQPIIVTTQRGNAPVVFITSPADGGVLNLGANNRITASASLVGGSIQSVEFRANGRAVGVPDTVAPYEVDFRPDSPGTYEISAIATGSNGQQTISPVVRANVASGRAPTVTITAPERRLLTMPQVPLTLLWVSNDEDGFVTATQVLVNGQPAFNTNTGAGNFTYNFPSQGTYTFVVRATDNSGNTGDSEPVTVVVDNTFPDTSPIVNVDIRTFSDQGYVTGSQFYFNATATASGPGNTIPADGVSFRLGSNLTLPATQSSLLLGSQPVFSSGIYTIRAGSPTTVTARATDTQGNVGFSDVKTFFFANPFSPLPSVEMLPLESITPPSAGDPVELRAFAIFPLSQFNGGDNAATARVEFYANGVLLGIGAANTNPATTNLVSHTFQWTTPNVSGDYNITARAVQLNYNSPVIVEGNVVAVVPYYGSAISLNSTKLKVEAIPGNLPPGSNGAFVVDMFGQLLYRAPNFEEWNNYTQALDSRALDRASVVMAIMGFDETAKVFNRSNEYGLTSASAMMPFARLGLTPTETQVLGFLQAIKSDPTLLPITGSYSGIPDAPWNASYGLARGMAQVVLASSQFRIAYPAVTGLANVPFNDWMREKMFAGVSGGDENRIINMMNTIAPQSLRQGAAIAFRSELASVALEAGYIVAPEQKFQLRAGTSMLTFQLTGRWSNNQNTPLYSKSVVQNILNSAGYLSGTAVPSPSMRAQSIKFKAPKRLVVGKTYTFNARATSRLPVTLVLQDPAGVASVVSSGPNRLRVRILQPGVFGVAAVQGGGTNKRGRTFQPAPPVEASLSGIFY